GGDDAHGRFTALHDADLDWRGLRPQEDLIRDVKGILHVSCRMVRRDVEGFKVVVVGLNLRALNHFKAQPYKDFLDLAQDLGKRVKPTLREPFARQGDIDRLGCKPRRDRGLFKFAPARLEGFVELVPQRIDRLAYDGTLLRRKLSHAAQKDGELSLFPQKLDSGILEGFDV